MSNATKEFETRAMISQQQYVEMVSFFMHLRGYNTFIQNTNIYFDTDSLFLLNNHITLRLRSINEVQSELTLKIKGSNGDDEITDSLTPKDVDSLLNQNIFPGGKVRKYLLTLETPLSDYQQIAKLYNRRLEIPFSDHTLVIDKNVYGDITDYNIEIEAKNNIEEAQKYLKEYIDKFNLDQPNEKYIGKARRAISEARKKRN